jgi:hypothetical protein
MRPITFRMSIGWQDGPTLDASKTGTLLFLLGTLADHNTRWLSANPGKAPKLYASGVRYQREADAEDWKDIVNVYADRQGDCEDLACWRVAELRVQGIKAEPFLYWQNTAGGGRLYHALCWRESIARDTPPRVAGGPTLWPARDRDGKPQPGWVEDPSRVLGM